MTKSVHSKVQITEPLVEAIWDMWGQIDRKPRVRMVGYSMRPLIKEGDTLLIDPQPKTIRIGDVVIYLCKGKNIAHRVISIQKLEDKTLLLLKGDHVFGFDPPLPREKVIGKVLGKEGVSNTTDYSSRWWLVLNTIMAVFSWSVGRIYRLYRKIIGIME